MNTEEISIPVPWGHIAAKLWSRRATSDGDGGRPREPEDVDAIATDRGGERVMCLHGYQDNCASFDQLVPLLDPGNVYLCLDLPNHGLSSGTPIGVRWTLEFYVAAVERVARHLRWDDPFVCVGHSMGGQIFILFAALYPERVRKLVILDTAGPVAMDPDEVVEYARKAADLQLRLENRAMALAAGPKPGTTPAPLYNRSQALDRIRRRTFSQLSERSAETLLSRYLRPGPVEGQFLLNNDVRLKVTYNDWFSVAQHRDVVNNVRCSTLLVRATHSDKYYGDVYAPFVHMYATRPNFRTIHVPGNHDVHMDHPHRVAPIINAFLQGSAAGSSKL